MRRILPALLLVILASLIAGWVLLLPVDFLSLGHQAASAAAGISNFYFLHNTSYFDRAAGTLPLLHTWTLGVEEQFYLCWPLVSLLMWRLSAGSRPAAVAFLAVVIVLSLGWAAYVVGINAKVAFYMLPGRAWELALGALVAFAPTLPRRWLVEGAVVVGLALIAFSAFTLNYDSAFPGLNVARLPWRRADRVAIAAEVIRRPGAGRRPGGVRRTDLLLDLSVALAAPRLFPRLRRRRRADRGRGGGPVRGHARAVGVVMVAGGAAVPPTARQAGCDGGCGRGGYGCRCRARAARGGGGRIPLAVATRGADLCQLHERGWRRPRQARHRQLLHQDPEEGRRRWTNPCLQLVADRPNVLVIGDSHSSRFSLALAEDFPDVQFFALARAMPAVVHPSGRAGDPTSPNAGADGAGFE